MILPLERPRPPIRLMVVEDHEVVRVGLRALFARAGGVEVVGEAASVREAVGLCGRLQPDVVLLDLRLPDARGAEGCRAIRGVQPGARVLVLTSYADEEVVIEALRAGAQGYLLKEVNGAGLVEAVERVAAGQSVLDPAITRCVGGCVWGGGAGGVGEVWDRLSFQARRVLEGVAEGETNKEIAVRLGLSDKTVKNYLSSVLQKLGMRRRSQAAAYYVRRRSGSP